MKVMMIAPVPYYDVHIPKSLYEADSYSFAISKKEHETKTIAFRKLAGELLKDGVVYDPANILLLETGDDLRVNVKGDGFYALKFRLFGLFMELQL